MTEPTQILAGPRVRTISGNKGLQIEQPLIFEQGMKGRSGVDLPPSRSTKTASAP